MIGFTVYTPDGKPELAFLRKTKKATTVRWREFVKDNPKFDTPGWKIRKVRLSIRIYK